MSVHRHGLRVQMCVSVRIITFRIEVGKSGGTMKVFVLALLAGLLFTGCSSNAPSGQQASPEPAKPKADSNQAATGRVAFQRMYVAARGWTRDAMPVSLESQPTKEFAG